MNEVYEAWKRREDIKWEKKRIELWRSGNRAYNKGLIKGLGWRGLLLYPFLMRPE